MRVVYAYWMRVGSFGDRRHSESLAQPQRPVGRRGLGGVAAATI